MDSSKIVIYGASGFMGNALVERLYKKGKITAVARNEGNLIALKEKYPNIDILTGDIADPFVVKKSMQGADEVYLLSAMKHVGMAEVDVQACVKTNIVGTMNVVNESLVVKPDILMFISTDKAAQPAGVYGCSKKIGEKLISEAESVNPLTKYRVVRFGNVFGSTGSFITKWKPKMLKGEEIIMTDPSATRFFFTVNDAVNLVFECIEKAIDSTPYIPQMKSVSMGVALEACMEKFGKCPVKVIGLQVGENFRETMDGKTYSNEVEQFTKEEFIEKFL